MYSKNSQYKKARRTKSQIFNGSPNSKFNIPSYYQKKGRTIQPSLSRLYNPPMEMPSTQSLNRMYNTLVQYKYKFPNQPGPAPVVIPQPFILTQEMAIIDLFPGDGTESVKFENADLILLMEAIDKPILPNGYHYNYQLIKIGYFNDVNGQASQKQFTIDWYSNLINGQLSINSVSLFIKSVDTGINLISYRELFASPYGENQIQYTRLAITAGGGVTITYPTVGNNDPDPTDNYTYPLMDTDSGENALYYGYLQVNPLPAYNTNNNKHFVLHILCIPTED